MTLKSPVLSLQTGPLAPQNFRGLVIGMLPQGCRVLAKAILAKLFLQNSKMHKAQVDDKAHADFY